MLLCSYVIPSQIRPPTPYSAPSIITPISGHKAYSKGLIKHSAFMYAARANALYTPSKSYRNTFVKGSPVPVDQVSLRIRALSPIEPGDPPQFPPKEAFTPIDAHGAPLCPLCSGTRQTPTTMWPTSAHTRWPCPAFCAVQWPRSFPPFRRFTG